MPRFQLASAMLGGRPGALTRGLASSPLSAGATLPAPSTPPPRLPTPQATPRFVRAPAGMTPPAGGAGRFAAPAQARSAVPTSASPGLMRSLAPLLSGARLMAPFIGGGIGGGLGLGLSGASLAGRFDNTQPPASNALGGVSDVLRAIQAASNIPSLASAVPALGSISKAGIGGVPLLGPAAGALNIGSIATSDQPVGAKAAQSGMAALSMLPGMGYAALPQASVQALDLITRLFGGGGLFSGNRRHRPVSDAQAAASAEARRQGMLSHYGSVLGMTNQQVERHASANTALSIPEMVTVIQGMPVQDTSNPATIDARLQQTTPGFLSPYKQDLLQYGGSRIPRDAVWVPEGEFGGSWAPPAASAPPTWEELSGWTPSQGTSF